MSRLLLRIDKRLERGRGRAPKVPVKIYPVAVSGTERESTIHAFASLSDRDEDSTLISLKAGRYYVETVLPSGETLADDVSVAEGGTTRLILKGEAAPARWLSWQDFSGNPLGPAPPPAQVDLELLSVGRVHTGRSAIRSIPRQRTPASRPSGPFERLSEGMGRSGGARLTSSAPRTDRVNLGAPIELLNQANPTLQSADTPGKVWRWLRELTGRSREIATAELNSTAPAVRIRCFARNSSQAVFHMTPHVMRDSVSLQTGYSGAHFARAFAVVPRRRSLELLFLPMPWLTEELRDGATIEVGITQQRNYSAFCSSIIAQDSHFGVLLSYLSAGALPTAQAMAEPALDFLQYKYRNPFAAAAGGYALVGTMSRTHQEKWHDWIHNLMVSFPSIPDGAILWAQLMLRMRRDPSDVREASKALKLAFSRGIPFYSMGVKWLMEGLESISRHDAEAREMLRAVQGIAWRTNYQQPFTILRIANSQDV